MSWRKHFKVVTPAAVHDASPFSNSAARQEMGFRNYQSHLPEVYIGHPNRIERYNSYEHMDADS